MRRAPACSLSPLYFVKRGSAYLDVAGASFRDLLAGRLAAAPGERATIADWANHLSSIFPEVRLKRYLEMRGADVGPPERIAALSALMVGLYYDADALRSAEDLIKDWNAEDRQNLRDQAPRLGLAAKVRGRDLRWAAIEMLAIAHGGLKRRARLNGKGEDETTSGSAVTRARGRAPSILRSRRRFSRASCGQAPSPASPGHSPGMIRGSMDREGPASTSCGQRAKSSWSTCMRIRPGPAGATIVSVDAPTLVTTRGATRGPKRAGRPPIRSSGAEIAPAAT